MRTTVEQIETLEKSVFKIIELACMQNDVSHQDFFSQKRFTSLVDARKMVSAVLVSKEFTYKKIGKIISMLPKDHSSIVHYMKAHHNHLATDNNYREKFFYIKNLTTK